MSFFQPVNARGTRAQVAQRIGQQLAPRLHEAVARRRELIPDYEEHARKVFQYLEFARQYVPLVVKEVIGIAHGAEMAVQDYALMNIREIVDLGDYVDTSNAGSYKPQHCTTVLRNQGRRWLVGHNEDTVVEKAEDLVLTQMEIDGVRLGGLQYEAELLGPAVAWNQYGLLQCIDYVPAHDRLGVPCNFIERAVLECQTIDEAVALIKFCPSASGSTHILVQGDRAVCVETMNDEVLVKEITSFGFAHANNYVLSDELAKLGWPASDQRVAIAMSMLPDISTAEDMQRLLRSPGHGEGVICGWETVGSFVWESGEDEYALSYDRPDQNPFKQLPLLP